MALHAPAPAQLRRDLREGAEPFVRHRRVVAGLTLFNVASMGLIAAYQMGLLRRVPEPRLPGLDADRVNGSDQAYALLATPDAVLGLGSYAATLGLTAMGGADRARVMPYAPLALAAKATFDAAAALALFRQQPARYRAFSFWSVLSTLATVAVVPLVLPEAWDALCNLRRPMHPLSSGPFPPPKRERDVH